MRNIRAIGTSVDECNTMGQHNSDRRDEDQVDPGTHDAFGGASCTPVACVSCNGGKRSCVVVVVTDLDTEHGGTGANKRDGARQLGLLSVADLDL